MLGNGSPSGIGRTPLGGVRDTGSGSVQGRRSGEMITTGITEEDEEAAEAAAVMEEESAEDLEEVEEVDQFGPELDTVVHRPRGGSETGGGAAAAVEGATLQMPPLSPLPHGENDPMGSPSTPATFAQEGIGGVPLTAEALKQMEEQAEAKEKGERVAS